jgi:D-glycero-D-manno-heptose 1,7-bisphosphate phosphatase
MNKAIFLDRDGVINNDYDNYYVFRPEDIMLNPGIPELLYNLKQRGFLLIVISNQGGISKGIYTQEDVEKTNARIEQLLAPYQIKFEEIYYCPHYHETENCICRKPGTLMIEKAISRYNIDNQASYFIGDRETDMEAGNNSGLKTIKVIANQDMSPLIDMIS